jgi:NitT/TauT family transport system substrate-binding protein
MAPMHPAAFTGAAPVPRLAHPGDNTMLKRTLSLLAGSLALAAMLVAAPAAHAQAKLTVAYSPSVDFVSVYVAKEKGFFARQGLDVTLTPMLSSLIPAAMASGSVQIGMPTTPVALASIDAGLDQVVVAGAAVTDPATMKDVGIVVRAGSAIHTPADLQGKKVGVPGVGALLHVLAKQWMVLKGVDPAKVSFVEVTLPTMNDVLRGGTVDAVLSVDPITSRMVAANTGTMLAPIFVDLPAGTSTIVFTASRDWAKANAKQLNAFRDAVGEAMDFVAKNPAEGQALVGKFLNTSPEVLASMRRPAMRLDISDKQIGDWIEIMKRQSMIKTKLSPADYLLK